MRDKRGFDLSYLEEVVATVGAAAPALNLRAMQLAIALEFRFPSGSDSQQAFVLRHQSFVL
jgi:hypothetical protein